MIKLIIQILITIIIIILLIYSYKYKKSTIRLHALENIPMEYIVNKNIDPKNDLINLSASETINIPIKELIKTPILGEYNRDKIKNNLNKMNTSIDTNINQIKSNIDNYNISKIKQEQEDLLLQTKVEFNDIKQLLQKQNEIINKQTQLLDKQSQLLDKIPEINKKAYNKYDDSIIEHKDENIDVYFKELRAMNEPLLKASGLNASGLKKASGLKASGLKASGRLVTSEPNIVNDMDVDYEKYYKTKIEYVKSYLEDPATRGYNIYESEQFSKLLDIGNIKVNDKVEPLPYPTNYARSIELKKI